MLLTRLLLVLEVCNVKQTYRNSWAGNHLMWSDLTLNQQLEKSQAMTSFTFGTPSSNDKGDIRPF